MRAAHEAVAYVGLGSNLDGPVDQVRRALEALARLPLTSVTARSSLYGSAPIGPQDQPDFVNAVAAVTTRLSPLALLDQLQALEQRHRRVRQRHWGPRTLDLDLLCYADLHLSTSRLTLPHPEMPHRRFVIEPLAEIAPSLTLAGASLTAWRKHLCDQTLHRLAP
ncbi:2-amino-4-hydroxy-6-hydroxymethyldihydropteridine diphosphokinase [Salinicola aestuarinus]|uniref:2-amino-4-hydroxy-6- hydroxymethyldihydropteridine diphosphokinase n=1 Tax=Salinicola aestuarinus TaxID=1949082 RepID=UPI000DA1E3BF|nr:2-amino-4-hydroxy-6-hydroxymethyldihydropteridine diphosphokinase [Salinicola aestuarinus]